MVMNANLNRRITSADFQGVRMSISATPVAVTNCAAP